MTYIATLGELLFALYRGGYEPVELWADDGYMAREFGEGFMFARDNAGIGVRTVEASR